MTDTKMQEAFRLFDEYNSKDPKMVIFDNKEWPDNLLYGSRMTERLNTFNPDASEPLQLAARCQHIGRWEIPRSSYPMDRKGYLQWRTQQKIHQGAIAGKILAEVGYDEITISHMRDLLMKKNLKTNPDTQTLEDVICLVFLEYYFDDFAKGHAEEKVVDILKKTMMKMSVTGLKAAQLLPLSASTSKFIHRATVT